MLISTARNGLFEGIPFMLIGVFFARREVKMKMKTAVLCLFGSLAFFAAECLMLIPSLGGELSAPFQYLFVFCSSLLLSYIIMRASGRAAWLKCLYK